VPGTDLPLRRCPSAGRCNILRATVENLGSTRVEDSERAPVRQGLGRSAGRQLPRAAGAPRDDAASGLPQPRPHTAAAGSYTSHAIDTRPRVLEIGDAPINRPRTRRSWRRGNRTQRRATAGSLEVSKNPLAFCGESQASYRWGPGGSEMAGQPGFFDGDDWLRALVVLHGLYASKLGILLPTCCNARS